MSRSCVCILAEEVGPSYHLVGLLSRTVPLPASCEHVSFVEISQYVCVIHVAFKMRSMSVSATPLHSYH